MILLKKWRTNDERDDDRSHRRVSIMSSLDAGWFRLITNILIQSRDLAMIASTSVAPWRHKCSHVPVFRRLFDRLPVRISTSDLHHRILRKKLSYQLMIMECSFHLTSCSCSDPEATHMGLNFVWKHNFHTERRTSARFSVLDVWKGKGAGGSRG